LLKNEGVLYRNISNTGGAEIKRKFREKRTSSRMVKKDKEKSVWENIKPFLTRARLIL